MAEQDQEYDIFEKLPDGGEVWHCAAVGLDDVRTKIDQLGQASRNMFFATPKPKKRVNESESATQ